MDNPTNTPQPVLYRCSHCKQWLPAHAFSHLHTDPSRPLRCRECDSAMVREARLKRIAGTSTLRAKRVVLIPQVADREERLRLILHAKEVVRQRIARARQLALEEEFQGFK